MRLTQKISRIVVPDLFAALICCADNEFNGTNPRAPYVSPFKNQSLSSQSQRSCKAMIQHNAMESSAFEGARGLKINERSQTRLIAARSKASEKIGEQSPGK